MRSPAAFADDQSPPQPPARLTRAGAAFAGLHGLTGLAVLLQIVIDSSYDNLICCVLVSCSATVTFLYIRSTRAMREVPLSTLAVLGLCLTTQWGALVGQAALWDSLTANLRVPLQTFGYLLGFQLVAVAAHWVSRRLSLFMTARRVGTDVLLTPLGIFRIPSVQAVWVIGGLGLLSLFVTSSENSLLGKIAGGLAVLAWAPFTIPLLQARLGARYCDMRRQVPFLILFGAAAVLLGLAFNFRAVMLIGVLTAVLLFLMALLDDERPFKLGQLKYLAAALVVMALLFQPLTYFFTAIQVARDQRDKLSKVEMIQYTWEVLQDPEAIRKERDKLKLNGMTAAYDEYYFKSSIVGRLVETKFHDNSFFMVQDISPLESRWVAEDAMDRVWSILPYPVLKWLGQERSKYATLYSAGDLLIYLRYGFNLGGFATGSMFAQGIAIFGVWTPFLYFLVCIPVFIAWDVLSRPGSSEKPAVLSLIGMLLVYRLFAYGIVTESIGNIAGVLLRFQLQNVLLYALVFALTRSIWKPFDARARLGNGAMA